MITISEYDKIFQVVKKDVSIEECDAYKKHREKWNHYTKTLELVTIPLHVDIELTNACNINCVMCERCNMTRKIGFMSLHLFRKIIDQCALFQIDSVKLNLWGESTLHSDLINMIKYAKNRGILNTQLNTNGVLWNEKLAKSIFESGLDRLTFSLDGATQETYERIRIKSNFGRVITNLNTIFRLKQKHGYNKPLITLQVIQMKDTEKEIKEFIEKWEEKADYITVTNIGTVSGMQKNINNSIRDYSKMQKIPCPQLWQRLSIYWNGDVSACCSDFNGFLKIGSINDYNLRELWNSNMLNDLRSRHKKLDFKDLICQSCTGNLE